MSNKDFVHYHFTKETYVIKPAYHVDYQSIIVNADEVVYSTLTPMQIIHYGCLLGGADYNGRRNSVIFKIHSPYKVPIPVNPAKGMYFFPTRSPLHMDCYWISLLAIQSISEINEGPYKSAIRFRNGKTVKLKVSRAILKNQLERTILAIATFHSGFDFPKFD